MLQQMKDDFFTKQKTKQFNYTVTLALTAKSPQLPPLKKGFISSYQQKPT